MARRNPTRRAADAERAANRATMDASALHTVAACITLEAMDAETVRAAAGSRKGPRRDTSGRQLAVHSGAMQSVGWNIHDTSRKWRGETGPTRATRCKRYPIG